MRRRIGFAPPTDVLARCLVGRDELLQERDTAPTGSGLVSTLAVGSDFGFRFGSGLLVGTLVHARRSARRLNLPLRPRDSISGRTGGIGTDASSNFAAGSAVASFGSLNLRLGRLRRRWFRFHDRGRLHRQAAPRASARNCRPAAPEPRPTCGAIVSVRTTFGLMTSSGFAAAASRLSFAAFFDSACGDLRQRRTRAGLGAFTLRRAVIAALVIRHGAVGIAARRAIGAGEIFHRISQIGVGDRAGPGHRPE